jgi:DNA-binding NtrC family response regulator
MENPIKQAWKTVRSAWIDSQGKQYFSELLARHKGNVSSAAREAQISRKSFYQLMKKFDLGPGERHSKAAGVSPQGNRFLPGATAK